MTVQQLEQLPFMKAREIIDLALYRSRVREQARVRLVEDDYRARTTVTQMLDWLDEQAESL